MQEALVLRDRPRAEAHRRWLDTEGTLFGIFAQRRTADLR